MDPLLSALLRSWEWRADVIAMLAFACIVYAVGWKRIRSVQRGRSRRGAQTLAAGWRLATYLGGWLIVALALLSPLEVLSGQLFFMHMILMDSENNLAMNLGETYLVNKNGNERVGKHKLDLVIL